MSLSQKVQDFPFICGVYLNFSSKFDPVNNADILQNFFDTDLLNSDIEQIYISKSKTQFQEQSQPTRSGDEYKQQLTISFPITSIQRSENIERVKKAKNIIIRLTNGRYLLIGRNDIETNTKPKVKFQSNERIAVFQFETKSIFPTGYTFLEGLAGFPFLIPINT